MKNILQVMKQIHTHTEHRFNAKTKKVHEAECCGVGPNIESSFESTDWRLHPFVYNSVGQRIPVQCCISQSNVFPYSTVKDSNCTSSMVADGYFHSQSCDVVVKNRLEAYSTIFIVLMAIIILAEICCVVTTVLIAKRFKQEETILNRCIKASGDGTEIRKDDKTQKEKDNTKIERKHGDTQAKGPSRNKRSRLIGTVDVHQRENTIVQENAEENFELQLMKSMEFEDTVSEKRDKPTNKRRQEEDEFAENVLTMPDN
ncbi:Hypothetical predicted protein [Mytilus galloprovincialis]|uniref:Uncharacterized protein n=1 Tax=Mytilus galloprovincialis TaxID=29158 RepID=A0A8B6EM71_MYTGA|nr:Hypothetical predicted protein [Mytilus galloprovincialis]